MSAAEPVLVVVKAEHCPSCINLTRAWSTINETIKRAYPKLRIVVITIKDMSNPVFDFTKFPKGLFRLNHWFPATFLIPGPLWDKAMGQLGPNNPVQFKVGTQVMNANWTASQQLVMSEPMKYNVFNGADYVKWIQAAINTEEFKRIQFAAPVALDALLAGPAQVNPAIQPLNNNPIKPLDSQPTKSGLTLLQPGSRTQIIGAEAANLTRSQYCGIRMVSNPY